MALRVCAEDHCPTLVPPGARKGRCKTHQRAQDRARGTKAERGYGADHRRGRARWVGRLRSGDIVRCWRCGERILTVEDLHYGHDDHDRTVHRGPEHGLCNLSAAGKASHGIFDGKPWIEAD